MSIYVFSRPKTLHISGNEKTFADRLLSLSRTTIADSSTYSPHYSLCFVGVMYHKVMTISSMSSSKNSRHNAFELSNKVGRYVSKKALLPDD